MVALPPPVQDYLLGLLSQQQAPLVIEIDARWQLTAVHGTGAPPAGLLQGEDIRPALPFLIGQAIAEPFVLPMIALDGDRVFNIHGLPTEQGAHIVFLAANEERDNRRALQQKANEVRLLNQRQERLVAELSQAKSALEQREADLVRANHVKARFIAGMSHEFRTPLTAILGYAELIEDGASQGGAADLDVQISSVSRAARHLLSMVDNILDQARLEDGQVVISDKPLVVRELVDDLTAIVAPLAAARFLGFAAFVAVNVPDVVHTDGMRLRQILLNLLGNAVKFTEQGEVRLDVSWQAGELVCSVTDTGPGIAPGEQQTVFEAFERGNASDTVGGVGLGLDITRRLCELLGGRIDLESELGRGSRFTACLPMRVAHESLAPSAAAPTVAPSGDGAHVLVAEDDPDIIDLVQIILGQAGYRVTIAINGSEALEMAQQLAPDLVLMDVNMPVMNGLEAARAMRAAGLSCPIIALSASLGVADRNDAIGAGYDEYLLKPIARAELLHALGQHLKAEAL